MLRPATSLTRRHVPNIRAGATCAVALIASLVFCSGGGVLALLGMLMATCAMISLGIMLRQPRADRAAERRDRARRRKSRGASAVRQHQYEQLRELANEIAATDPAEAERCEVETLLDSFVDLCVTHRRCSDALRRSDGVDCTMPALRRHGVAVRRLRHRAQCQTRLDDISEQIDATAELLMLISQRVAFAAVEPHLEDDLDRRIAELDDADEPCRPDSHTTT